MQVYFKAEGRNVTVVYECRSEEEAQSLVAQFVADAEKLTEQTAEADAVGPVTMVAN